MDRSRLTRRLLRAGPLLGWLAALAPALTWISTTLQRPEHRGHALVAVGALALALARGLRPGPLTLRPAPLALALASLGAFLALERTLDISLLSAAAAIVALYALMGLYVSPGHWRRARAGALLALATLPIADQADHYLGFALRMGTARLVAHQLSALGLAPVAAETILVLERGVADIEAACSGLSSVWAGVLLLLGVAYVRRRPIDGRFALALVLQSGLLFVGNVLRITTLVVLAHHFDAPGPAALVHEPLGVLGFMVAGAVGVGALLAGRRRPAPRRPRPRRGATPRAFAPALLAVGLLATAAYARRPAPPAEAGAPPLAMPRALGAEAIDLSPAEADLFRRWGAPQARKLRLRRDDLTAQVVLVPARSWRAHHPPATCLAGSGYHIDGLRPARIGDVQATFAPIDGGRRTAVYWFQSLDRTTGSLLDRVADGVRGGARTWVLVTVLVDRSLAPDAPALRGLVADLFAAVQGGLTSVEKS